MPTGNTIFNLSTAWKEMYEPFEPTEEQHVADLVEAANAGIDSLKELSTKYKDKYKLVKGKLVLIGDDK